MIAGATLAAGMLLSACGGGGPQRAAPDSHAAATFVRDGLAAEAASNLALANEDYLRALEKDPKETDAWYDLGVIAQQRGFDHSAEKDYERALRVDTKYVPALFNLATLVATRSPHAAVHLYDDVLRVEPHDARAHLNLGFALEAEGKAQKGQAQIADAVALDPSLAPSSGPGTTTPTTQSTTP